MINTVLSNMYIMSSVYISLSSPAVMGTNKYLSISLVGNLRFMWSVYINNQEMHVMMNFLPRTFENVKCEIGNDLPLTAKGYYKNFSFQAYKPRL